MSYEHQILKCCIVLQSAALRNNVASGRSRQASRRQPCASGPPCPWNHPAKTRKNQAAKPVALPGVPLLHCSHRSFKNTRSWVKHKGNKMGSPLAWSQRPRNTSSLRRRPPSQVARGWGRPQNVDLENKMNENYNLLKQSKVEAIFSPLPLQVEDIFSPLPLQIVFLKHQQSQLGTLI